MIESLFWLLAGIVVILAIIAANGYFVAQEFAFMAVNRTRLAARAGHGDKSAKRALAVTRRTSFMLSGAQLGITVTGLLVGNVAEPLVGNAIAVLLGGAGVAREVGIGVGTMLALSMATLVQMIFGELYPKNLAIANPEPMARTLAGSTLAYMAVFGWLISFFDKSANLLLRAVRIEPVHDLDVSASADDLPRIIAQSRESGDLPVDLSLMMDRMLDFPERTVEHAMVPRTQVDWVGPDTGLAELRDLMARAHTRYPVVDARDMPVGVVHLADVLERLARGHTGETVSSVMRPAPVIPTLMSLPDSLEELVSTDNQIACVIDEYGGFVGVLTIEDLAMEIVGEITDEHDTGAGDTLVAEGEGIWLMDGDVHLDEVERAIGFALPRGDVETIGGLVIAQVGDLPEIGDTVTVGLPADPSEIALRSPTSRHIELDVLKVERRVPKQVRVRLVQDIDKQDEQ